MDDVSELKRRCMMYQRYVVVAVDLDNGAVPRVKVVRGFDELAVARGERVGAKASFNHAVSTMRAELECMDEARSEYVVELWGHPYPKNGGVDPVEAECLLSVSSDDYVPAVSPAEEMMDELQRRGPQVPNCRR